MIRTPTETLNSESIELTSEQAFINTLVAVSFNEGDVSALALALINQKLACKDFLLDQDLSSGLRTAIETTKKLGTEKAIDECAPSVSKEVTMCCFANAVHLAYLITGINPEKSKLLENLMEAWTIDYESYRMILETIKLMNGKDFKIAIKL